MRKKLYTAFLSSNYSGLKNERSIAIKKLLDANVFPVTMEHFVIGSTDGFRDICELIDDSDVFILLMSTRYGSRDERGDNKSWTEKEFDYALENNQKMLIVRFSPLETLLKNYRDDMTDDEVVALCPDQSATDTRDQVRFARSIAKEMIATVQSETEFSDIIGKFLNTIRRDPNVAGWIRDVSVSEIEKILPLGTYYHCHLCDTQPGYLRVGEVSVTCSDGGGYNLHFEGKNYKGKAADGKITVNETKYTVWSGDYVLDPIAKTLQGIYSARKTDVDNKGERVIKPGTRDGIHRFAICDGEDGECFMHGTSQDAVTEDRDGKECNISVFRTREARDKYVIKYFDDED